MKGGIITEAQQKQKQLAATEALWTAYGKASDTVGGTNAEYKARQDALGQQIVSLGGETKSLQEAQKQAEESYKQVAAQTQKMATAQEEANKSIASGDLKHFYAADKKLTAAGGQSAATGMDMSQVFTATQANITAFVNQLKEQIIQTPLGSELYNNLTAQLADTQTMSNLLQVAIKNGIDPAKIGLVPEEFWTKVFGENPGDYIKPETWQGIIGQLNAYLKEQGIQIVANLNTGEVKDEKRSSDKEFKEFNAKAGQFISGLANVSNGLKGLGLQLPEGVDQILGAMSSVMQVIQGVNTVISVFSASAMTANTAAIIANTAALYANSFLSVFSNGGVAHAANGWSGTVPGTSYSGDNVPIMVNSGELILNRAQQGVIAQDLESGGLGDLQLELRVDAEEFIIMLNNNGKRRGLGRLING